MRATAIVRAAGGAAYGAYVWLALLAVVCPLCGVLAVTPGLARRRGAARRAARLFFLLIGSPVRRLGAEIPEGAAIVVANHASYLDGLILTAALPPTFTFLIKHEMATVPLAGFVLTRLGSRFVDRGDPKRRRESLRDLVASAAAGDALALFPEGTFDEVPGLKPFQLGAFAAASRAGRPIVPVVILGSRAKFPAGRLLAAPGALAVRLCGPIEPAEHRSVKSLMRAARDRMLAHLPEPDLAAHAVAPLADPLPYMAE